MKFNMDRYCVNFNSSFYIIAMCYYLDEKISFTQNEYTIAENGGSVNLLVNRTTNASVNVELQIIPLSANDLVHDTSEFLFIH